MTVMMGIHGPIPRVHLDHMMYIHKYDRHMTALHVTPAPTAVPIDRLGDGTTLHLAGSLAERRDAWALVNERYHQLGLSAQAHGRWYGTKDGDPQTLCFTARDPSGRLVATVSLAVDSPLGIPAMSAFPQEIERLRAQHRCCEMMSLASTVEEPVRGMRILEGLFRCAYWSGRVLRGCDLMLAVMHPHHAGYYRRRLCFHALSDEVVAFDKVRGAPGVLLRLDMVTANRVYAERFGRSAGTTHHFFFHPPHVTGLVQRIQRNAHCLSDAEFTEAFVDERAIYADAPPDTRRYLTNSGRYRAVARASHD
jgi:hypothetical protein